jgi:hypothetical protein
VTADSDVFYGFVFNGQDFPPEGIEEATRTVQRHLDSGERRRVNDTLLERLAGAKQVRRGTPQRELLDDPAISTLVNTLALVKLVGRRFALHE